MFLSLSRTCAHIRVQIEMATPSSLSTALVQFRCLRTEEFKSQPEMPEIGFLFHVNGPSSRRGEACRIIAEEIVTNRMANMGLGAHCGKIWICFLLNGKWPTPHDSPFGKCLYEKMMLCGGESPRNVKRTVKLRDSDTCWTLRHGYLFFNPRTFPFRLHLLSDARWKEAMEE